MNQKICPCGNQATKKSKFCRRCRDQYTIDRLKKQLEPFLAGESEKKRIATCSSLKELRKTKAKLGLRGLHPKKKKTRRQRRGGYESYIAGPDWAERRNLYFRFYPMKCCKCASTQFIHLHHRTYDHLREEWDEDLVALCSDCHAELHKMQKKNHLKVEEATELFLQGCTLPTVGHIDAAIDEHDFFSSLQQGIA